MIDVTTYTPCCYQMQFCNPFQGLWKYTYWLTDCTANALDLVQRERDRVFDTNTIVCVWDLHLIFCVCVLRCCTSVRFASPHTLCLRSSHGGELTWWPYLITPQQLPYLPCSTPKAPGPPPAPTRTHMFSCHVQHSWLFYGSKGMVEMGDINKTLIRKKKKLRRVLFVFSVPRTMKVSVGLCVE